MAQATDAMERITAVVGQDLQHHRADRRHRLPDQPAGAQRLGGSGAGRRCRQGLCGGRGGSAAAGAVGGAGLERGQGADRAVGQRSQGRLASWWPRRPASSRPCSTRRAAIQRADGRHRPATAASRRRRIEEVNAAVRQHGRDDPAQCGAGRGDQRRHRADRERRPASSTGSSMCSPSTRARRSAGAAPPAARRATRRARPAGAGSSVAARSYLSHGNAAVDKDWTEF